MADTESESFICLLVVCVFLPACVCVCVYECKCLYVCLPFVPVCVWPGRLISPALCAACRDARTRLDTVYQHQPHGSGLLLPLLPSTSPPPPLSPPSLPSFLSMTPVPGLSPNMCHSGVWPASSLEMAEREICCHGLSSHSERQCVHRGKEKETCREGN